jgi:zinc transport system substrate-binding protein
LLRIILVFCGVAVLAACGGSAGRDRQVVAAFYPLAFAAQSVGGPSLHVRNLTPAGAEPHDIELTPKDVAAVQTASVVLYLSHGFQPALEHAVREASGERVDVLQDLDLRAGVGDEAGKTDPHVWLDPVLYAQIVRRIGAALGRPRAASRLAERVDALDGAYRKGLAHCARREFVTTHAAFGYLAARYGLKQIAITGLDPESEPSAHRLASLAKLVRRDHIRTVFFEQLVSPKLAQTVAREAGVGTAVLDPIEGLTPSEESKGASYLTLMRQNLAALRKELECR